MLVTAYVHVMAELWFVSVGVNELVGGGVGMTAIWKGSMQLVKEVL